jgi:hypothetical protein
MKLAQVPGYTEWVHAGCVDATEQDWNEDEQISTTHEQETKTMSTHLFPLHTLLRATTTVQGLKAGELYMVTEIHERKTFAGNYVSYTVHDLSEQTKDDPTVTNLHLLAERMVGWSACGHCGGQGTVLAVAGRGEDLRYCRAACVCLHSEGQEPKERKHSFAPEDGWDIAYVRPWFVIRCRDRKAMRSAAARLDGRYFQSGANIVPLMSKGYERSLEAWVIRVTSYADLNKDRCISHLRHLLTI